MANTIQIKRKTTAGAPVAGDLAIGEMCLVVPDQALYIKVDASTVIEVTGGGSTATGDLPLFKAVGTSTGDPVAADIDITYASPITSDSPYTLEANNYEVTHNEDGRYLIMAPVGVVYNNRIELQAQLFINSGGGFVADDSIAAYVTRDANQDDGTVMLVSIQDLTAGDSIKIVASAVKDGTGTPALSTTRTRLEIIKLSGIKGDQGPAGSFDINGLTTENSIDTANDTVAFYDASAGVNRKTAISNLGGGTSFNSGRTLVSFSNGSGTISHGLGSTPSVVIVTLENAPSITIFRGLMVHSFNATTITVLGRTLTDLGSGAELDPLGGNYQVHWIAIP